MSENFSRVLACNNKQTYFFKTFEYSVQVLFDELCTIKGMPLVKVNSLIKRGNIYLKADYFLPLKSYETFQLNCDELLNKLRKIDFLIEVDVDSNFNLTFLMQRSYVYKHVLSEVILYNNKYGMTEKGLSVLVVINNDDNDFLKARNNQLAKHIISIFSANEIKVHYLSASVLSIKEAIPLTCSSECCLDKICDHVKEKLNFSEWKKETECINDLCIDAKLYLENNSLVDKYGKDIHTINLSSDTKFKILNEAAHLKHLLDDHLSHMPDKIIHIASHTVNRKTWQIGILLQMLQKSTLTQTYIFNQNVKISSNKSVLSYDDYVFYHKNEIEKAMSQKYDIDICKNQEWASRIQNLVDSVVKFDFLKLNPNMALKLDLSNSHSTEKNAGIFVQYNFARLSNLFRTFDTKVKEGIYDSLQPLDEVDFSLLRLEEEWNLFQYVLLFPKLVEKVLDSLLSDSSLKTRYPLNGICLMLSEMCHYLSLYYSKVRILTGSQKHLQNIMNARLWLLKGIYQLLLNSFVLLDIQGLDQM